jgi:hypothetical protein
MPALPPGEQDLRDHALRFTQAEGAVLALYLDAAHGDRARAIRQAIARLNELRLLDHRTPVATAYLTEHPKGDPSAVRDLAGSLARRLTDAAVTAAATARDRLGRVTETSLDQLLKVPLTAAVDQRGNRWALGHWATMNCTTIGRQATSRGLTDRLGDGRHVTVSTGTCGWCKTHGGDIVIGQAPLPPYHPSCSCTASAA